MHNHARMVELQNISEPRGEISILEVEKFVGFSFKRIFIVSGVPSNEKRGQHAHIEGEQLLIAITGSVSASIFDGMSTSEFQLNSTNHGLFMPKMTWGTQWNFTSDAKLLVLCSNSYDPSDYITDKQEFISRVNESSQTKQS